MKKISCRQKAAPNPQKTHKALHQGAQAPIINTGGFAKLLGTISAISASGERRAQLETGRGKNKNTGKRASQNCLEQ